MSQDKDFTTIRIRDDGGGLTEEALQNFGKKRPTRQFDSQKEGRISIGLGSVIMQAIALAHGGRVEIRNLCDVKGVAIGAELEIRIPTLSAAAA